MNDLKYLRRKALLEPGRLTRAERRALQAAARLDAAAGRCLSADSLSARRALASAAEALKRNLSGPRSV